MSLAEWNDEHQWCTNEEIIAKAQCSRCLDGDCNDCDNCQEESQDGDGEY